MDKNVRKCVLIAGAFAYNLDRKCAPGMGF